MVNTTVNPVYASLSRQVNHWLQAASRLSGLDHLASGNAWYGLDPKIGELLRQSLQQSVSRVVGLAKQLNKQLGNGIDNVSELREIKKGLVKLRDLYLKTEETIHFYTVAVNSRTTPNIAALLRACDILCLRSMQDLLIPLDAKAPYVLTYIDKGVGASILKAGLRLWDGSVSRVATIKITQHNLFRPTAIIHETGHQVSHILDWNDELARSFRQNLSNYPSFVSTAFGGWASEICADAFAFVHAGYGSVAALHDVVSGSTFSVFAYRMDDPHPICYIRVLLNIQMCREFFGAGAWDDLEAAFKNDYDLNTVKYQSVNLIRACEKAIPDVTRLILKSRYRAFKNKSLSEIIDPMRVSPAALLELERTAGPALHTSPAWLWKECIRILALNGYKIATGYGDLSSLYKLQEEWMVRLGFAGELN